MTTATHPKQNVMAYRSDMFCTISGASSGKPLSTLDDLIPDNEYALATGASRARLSITARSDGELSVADDSDLGHPGAALQLDCTLTLLSPDGQAAEALVLTELGTDGTVTDVYLLPLTDLQPDTGYTLIDVERKNARNRFTRIACVSFSRGTHITMATGAQTPIEKIRVGARVLTRNNGAQTVRWIGHSSVHATGAFAPIVITAGTLNNTNDLLVSPDHRLFVSQQNRRVRAEHPELLVKARHLVNDDTVYVKEGGQVDYYQILFDAHHIIFAEGIAAESMLTLPQVRPELPQDLLEKLPTLLPGHDRHMAHRSDVQKALLDRPDAIELLRRASMR